LSDLILKDSNIIIIIS